MILRIKKKIFYDIVDIDKMGLFSNFQAILKKKKKTKNKNGCVCKLCMLYCIILLHRPLHAIFFMSTSIISPNKWICKKYELFQMYIFSTFVEKIWDDAVDHKMKTLLLFVRSILFEIVHN